MIQVFAVFDAAVACFQVPMFFRTKGEAIRMFSDACKDDKLPFASHPSDYTLFRLGEWDDAKGSLMPLVAPEKVIMATECLSA